MPEIVGLFQSTDAEERLDGLIGLAELADDAFGEEGSRLGASVRAADVKAAAVDDDAGEEDEDSGRLRRISGGSAGSLDEAHNRRLH